MRYQSIRILALLKLITESNKFLEIAFKETSEIIEKPTFQTNYENYPEIYPNLLGTMIPFSIEYLYCEATYLTSKNWGIFHLLRNKCLKKIQTLNSNSEPTLDKPFEMNYEELFKEENENDKGVWIRRSNQISLSIVTRQVQQKEYFLALETIKVHLKNFITTTEILSLMIRIHLSVGNIELAKNNLDLILKKIGSESFTYLLHKGFILMAELNYNEASIYFKKVLQVESYNIIALNSLSICEAYCGTVHNAINTLEDGIFSEPTKNINETSIYNLSLLYELISGNKSVFEKKNKIIQLVIEKAPDNFNIKSLILE